jgi:hypothetical protein
VLAFFVEAGFALCVATADFVVAAFVAAGDCAGCVTAGLVCVALPMGKPPESESTL